MRRASCSSSRAADRFIQRPRPFVEVACSKLHAEDDIPTDVYSPDEAATAILPTVQP